MPDLYGVGLGGLSMEDALSYLPSMMPRGPTYQETADQYRAQQFPVLPKLQDQQPAVPAAAPPPATEFISWPQYRAAYPNVDPAVAYKDYVTKVAPDQLSRMGYTQDQIPNEIATFVKANPPPESAPPAQDQGLVQNAGNTLLAAYRQMGATAKAGAAVAAQSPEMLRQAALEAQQAEQLKPEPLQRFQKETSADTGSLWGYLSNVAKASVGNWEGAFDAFLGTVAGFVPYMAAGAGGGLAGSAVPVVGSVAGAAAAMGLTAADLEAGGKAIEHLQQAATRDGIDLKDGPAVKKWFETKGAKEVFGPAVAAGLTSGAITVATMGITGALGARATNAVRQMGLAADAERTATAAGQPIVQAGMVGPTTNLLRQQARQAAVASGVGNVVGFGGASVAADVAAGDATDERDMLVNALTLALPSYFHARGVFKATRTGEAAKPAAAPATETAKPRVEPTQEELAAQLKGKFEAAQEPPPPPPPGGPPAEMGGVEQRAAYERTVTERNLDTAAGVKEALDAPTLKAQLDAEIAAVAGARDQPAKIDALERLAQAGDDKGGKYGTRVAERAQALADELKAVTGEMPEVRTLDEAIASNPDKVEEVATATQVARDLMKEVVDETVAQVKAEAQGRKAERAAPAATAEAGVSPVIGFATTGETGGIIQPTVPAAAELPGLKRGAAARKRAGKPAGNAPVVEGAGNVGKEPLGTAAGAGVNEEKLHAGTAAQPEGGQPAGGAGGNVEPTATRSVVPGRNERGARATGAGAKLKQGGIEAAFADWRGKLLKQWLMESKGQDILDDMEERGESPQAVARKFWTDTYFKLPAAVQERFRKMLKSHTGMEPGSAITQDLRARNWADVADQIDLGDKAENLEGTDRGFVALMKEANDRMAEVEDKQTEAQAAKLEEATRNKAATEEANRKAEADLKAALESEKLPPEEQVGPEAKVRTMDEVLDDYNARVRQAIADETMMKGLIEDQQRVIDKIGDVKTSGARDIVARAKFLIGAYQRRLDEDLTPLRQKLEADRRTQMQVVDDLKKGAFSNALDRLVASGHISKEQEPFYRALAGGQTRSALNYVIRNSDNPMYRALAKFLLQMRVVPEVRFAEPGGARTLGEYWMEKDKLNLDPGHFLQQAERHDINMATNTFLHEMVHGGTVNALSKAYRVFSMLPEWEKAQRSKIQQMPSGRYALYDPVTKEYIKGSSAETAKGVALWLHDSYAEFAAQGIEDYIKTPEYKAAENIFKTFDYLKNKFPFTFAEQQHYGAKNPFELVAEVFVNKQLQDYLRNITLPKEITGASKVMNAWLWFVDSVRKLLGVGDQGINNALANIIQNTAALIREREGMQIGSERFAKFTPEFNVQRATEEELAGKQLANRRYQTGNALAQEVAAQHQTDQAQEKKTQQTPRDAILGLNEKGNRSHIAYKRGENDYDLYPITDPTTEEGLAGDASLKQIGLTREQVYAALKEDGAEPLNGTAGFNRPTGNDRDMIVRWKATGVNEKGEPEAKLVYVATRDEQGDKWTVLTGNDLQKDNEPYTTTKVADRAAAVAESHKHSDFASKLQAENVFQAERTRDLLAAKGGGPIQVTMPSNLQIKGTEAGSPIRYVARTVEAAFKALDLALPKEWNLNVQYLLRNSDMVKRGEEMVAREGQPLRQRAMAMMDKYKMAPKELGDFMGAITVEHRNPLLRAKYVGEARYINPDQPLLGKSEFYRKNKMAQLAATKQLDAYEQAHPGFRDELRAFMVEAKKFSDGTVDLMRDSGRISATTAADIKNAYKIYAPLGTKKSRLGKATGQSAFAEDPIEKMFAARFAAIADDIDNRTKTILGHYARIADLRGDDGQRLFKVLPIEAKHLVHNVDSGVVDVSTALDTKNSFVFYEGGVPTRVEVTEPKLLQAIESYKGAERDTAIQAMLGYAGFYTRMFSALHTSLSVPFAFRNFIRDYATNLTQLDPRINYGAFNRAMFSGDVVGAAFRIGFHNAMKLLGKDSLAGSAFAQMADRDGAMIDHRSRYGADQIATDIRTSLAPTWSKRGLLNKTEEYLAPSAGKLTNFLSGMTHTLEAWNRLAVYKAAMESGIDHKEAATLAKMATTNFELRGTWMPYVSPFYAFANAKMQGARTMAENLGFSRVQGAAQGGLKQGALGLLPFAPKAASANLRTVKAAQMMLAIGLLSGYANYKTSPKDKDGRTTYGKMNEYQLDEYLHIPGTGLSIPIPQEIGSFFLTGNTMADQLWGDRAGSASTPAMRFITGMIQNFWPGGTSMHDPVGARGEGLDYLGRLVTPTPYIPFYDVAMNTTSFGQKVNPLKGSPTVPPEFQGAKYASPAANFLARHTPGLQAAPPDWDHIFQGLFGQQGITEKSIITNGPVGGLLQSTFRSFQQKPFAGTTKQDYDQVAIDVAHGAYRAKGGPLKTGQGDALKRMFDVTNSELRSLQTQVSKTTNEDLANRLRAREDELRARTLKRYYEATGVITP